MRLRAVLHTSFAAIIFVFLIVTLLALYNTKKSLNDLKFVVQQHVPSLQLLQTSHNIFNETLGVYNVFENSEYITPGEVTVYVDRFNFMLDQLRQKEGINDRRLTEINQLVGKFALLVTEEHLSDFSNKAIRSKELQKFKRESGQISQQIRASLQNIHYTSKEQVFSKDTIPSLRSFSNLLYMADDTIASYASQDFAGITNILTLLKTCMNTLKDLAHLNRQLPIEDQTQGQLEEILSSLSRYKSGVLLFDDEKRLGVSGANLEEITNLVRGAHLEAKKNFEELNTSFLQHIYAAQQQIIATNIKLQKLFILSFIVGALTMIAVLSVLKYFIIGSINSLVNGAESFAKGDFNYRIKVGKKPDYLTPLIAALNTMADHLLEYSLEVAENRQTLEEKVKRRTRDLEEVKQRAVNANRAKSLFLANMSHEIRTPMSAIIGMTHLAQKTEDAAQQNRFLNTVQQSANNLLGVLNDILDFSKIEAGQLEIDNHPFQLKKLLIDVQSMMSIQADEKGLNLVFVTDPQVPKAFVGDDNRIIQILVNLVGNAIKFTAKGTVTLRVELAPKKHSTNTIALHFSVNDTGIGIVPEKIEKIFNSFEQADNSYVRQYGGTGLGLAISKQLTMLMGGTLRVESLENHGSTFHFTLELEPWIDDVPENLAAEQLTPEVRSLKILVADDNLVNRDVARFMLEKSHEVTTADNGLEALEALRHRTFDLLLMDLQMPIMDGLTATSIIRKIEQKKVLKKKLPGNMSQDLIHKMQGGHIPIVALTAHAMSGDREKCIEAGMDNYLTKPLQLDHLSSVVNSLTTKASAFEKITKMQPDLPSPVPSPASAFRKQVTIHLQENTNLSNAQVKQVFAAACTGIVDNLDKAKEALAIEDYTALGNAAHTLKGTLLQCGLKDQAATAERIDYAAKNDKNLSFNTLLEALADSLADLLNEQ